MKEDASALPDELYDEYLNYINDIENKVDILYDNILNIKNKYDSLSDKDLNIKSKEDKELKKYLSYIYAIRKGKQIDKDLIKEVKKEYKTADY